MLTVEIANGSKNYQKAFESTNEDRAIYFFIDAIDRIKSNDSIRLVRNIGGTNSLIMARKTPNSVFVNKDWK